MPLIRDKRGARRRRLRRRARRRRGQRRADPRARSCSSRRRSRSCSPRSPATSWRARCRARVERLERAARKVAAGDFSNPIQADSDDELGQLAAAFDDMQRQLARLDTRAQAVHRRRPRTSCARRSSRSAASSSCSPTRSSTRRRGAQFLDQLRGQVDRHAQARHRAARPLAAGVRRARAAARADRRRPARARGRRRVHARRGAPRRRASRCDAAPDPIEVDCDPERVAQVLRILLDNALVHTPAGHRRSWFRPPASDGHVAPGGLRPRPRHQAPDHAPHLRALLHLQRRARRAPASAWRSRASSPSACTAA